MAEAVDSSSVPKSDNKKPSAVSKNEDERRQCECYLPLKRRRCRMQASIGSVYCGEHFDLGKEDNSGERRRIRCPLDPSHTVFESKLEQHIKKCNAAKKKKPSCFTADINAGLDGAGCQPDQVPLSSIPIGTLDMLISKLLSIESKYLEPAPSSVLTHPVLEGELSNPQNGPFAAKHLCQQASILGNMAAAGMLKGGNVYVEFGAGRGKLSHWLQQALGDNPAIKYVLVDRSNCRRKMDLYHRFDSQGPQFNRVLMDIKDLDLSKMAVLQPSDHLVGVTKHLCGAGTDLALRCAVEQLCPSGPQPHRTTGQERVVAGGEGENPNEPRQHGDSLPCPEPKRARFNQEEVSAPRLRGLAFALCCHQRCSWDSYVAKEFFSQELGLSAQEFDLVKRMSSWAVCGQRRPRPAGEGQQQTSSSPLAKSGKTTSHVSQDNHVRVPAPAELSEPTNVSAVATAPVTIEGGPSTIPIPLSQSPDQFDKLDQPLSPRGDDHDSRVASHSNYLPHTREHIGLLCKRLLDSGRVRYLRGRGLEARLVEYVDRSVSLENVLLLATVGPAVVSGTTDSKRDTFVVCTETGRDFDNA